MRRPARGFTLIELLLVMAIVAVLMIVLVVGLSSVWAGQIRTTEIIESLDSVLRSYATVFDGAYPPSDDKQIGTGAQCLYYYLMGPRERGWGPEAADGGVLPPYVWAPPNDLPKNWIGGGPGTPVARKFFCDGYPDKGRAILYYRADVEPDPDGPRPVRYDEVYDRSDNADGGSGAFWTPSPDDWRKLIRNPDSPQAAPYRPRSYLLIAPGDDRRFGDVEGTCDDITNFRRRN